MDDRVEDRHAKLMAGVLQLHRVDGLGVRAIAARLKISRNTVRKLLGSAPMRPTMPATMRPSILTPYLATVNELIQQTPEMRAPAMLERLRKLGYSGGVTVVRDYLCRIRPRASREAFLTLDFHPGGAMQIDWADFGFAVPGCPRRVSALVMALCYSRYLYIEFTLSQAFGTFVRAMERGLRFFAGTTLVDIFDNMKTVVQSHTAVATVFNHQFLAYARSRGFAVRACTPGRGNEKGRVERPIGFVRERFWPGRRFASLLDLNRQASEWRDDFANKRIHEQTGKIPALVYQHEERARLKPLPGTPFDTDDLLTTSVTKLFRVRFDRNTYSVPPRLVAQTVLVRANDERVSVYLGPKQVADHERSWSAGQDHEEPAHRAAVLEYKPRPASQLPPQLTALGPIGIDYFKVFAATHRSIERERQRLTFLCELFGEQHTMAAVDEVMRTGHVGAEYVEYVLRHKKGLVPLPPPIKLGKPELDDIHFAEPDLSVYDQHVASVMTLDPGELPNDQEDGP